VFLARLQPAIFPLQVNLMGTWHVVEWYEEPSGASDDGGDLWLVPCWARTTEEAERFRHPVDLEDIEPATPPGGAEGGGGTCATCGGSGSIPEGPYGDPNSSSACPDCYECPECDHAYHGNGRCSWAGKDEVGTKLACHCPGQD
jgi:hypothetical protein